MTPFMSIPGIGGPTPSFAKGGKGEASFTWKYHMHGSNMGSLRMYWMTSDGGGQVDDGTLTQITSPEFVAWGSATTVISGQQQTSSSAAWKAASIDLSEFWGETGRVAFLYIKSSCFSYTVLHFSNVLYQHLLCLLYVVQHFSKTLY